jgi:hypothetical protein
MGKSIFVNIFQYFEYLYRIGAAYPSAKDFVQMKQLREIQQTGVTSTHVRMCANNHDVRTRHMQNAYAVCEGFLVDEKS